MYRPQLKKLDYFSKSNILDGTTQGQMAFYDATLNKWTYTETSEMFWDDVNKRLKPSNLRVTGNIENYNDALPDIGAIQTSDSRGYGTDYISNKIISNSKFGKSGLEEDGGSRIKKQTDGIVRVEMYLEGEWKTVLTGVNIVTDGDEIPKDIEFTDFSPWVLSLITGDSDVKDINGLPMVQQMTASMGVIQIPQTLNGGTF